MITNKINTLDIFGTTFSFSTFGQRKFHTYIGLVLSILCYGTIAAFIVVFGNDMFKKINPKIITEFDRPLDYYRILPDQKKFTVAWRIMDQATFTFNMTGVFYPKIEYFRWIRNKTTLILERTYSKSIDAEQCTPENAPDPLFSQNLNLKDWNCIDFAKYNFTVGGTLDGNFVDYFRIRIYSCKDNKFSKANCTPLETLKKLFITDNKLYFQFYYPDFYFDPQSIDDPLKYQYQNVQTQLSQSIIKKDRAFFKNIYLNDDQNLAVQEWTYSNQTAFSFIDKDFGLKFDSDYNDPSLSSELYTLTFYFDKNGARFIRSYMKITDLAATVGGFMQIILVAGKILGFQYNSYQRNITLFNEIFEFQEDDPVAYSRGESFKKKAQQPQLNLDSLGGGEKEKDDILRLNIGKKDKEKEKETNKSKFNETVNNNSQSKTKLSILEMTPTEGAKLNSNSVNELADDSGNISRDVNSSLRNKNKSLKSSMGYTIVGASKDDLLKHKSIKTRKTELPKYDEKRENEIRKKVNEEKKKREETVTEFSLGCVLFVRRFMCPKNLGDDDKRKVNIYEFAVKHVQEKLDIICYMNLQTNFEKYQLFNFNEIQKYSFKHMRKPNLMLKDDLELFDIDFDCDKPLKDDEEQRAKDYSEQFLKIVKYFTSKLQDNEGICELDEKLFDLLDPKIKRIIIKEAEL